VFEVIFAYFRVLFEGTFTSVFIDKKSKRSHKIVEIKVFLTYESGYGPRCTKKRRNVFTEKKSASVFGDQRVPVPTNELPGTDILSYQFCYLFFVLFRAAVCIHLSNLST
jgi:hypothetical protein